MPAKDAWAQPFVAVVAKSGRIAQIASLARRSILSRPKAYYIAQGTGLKQIWLGFAYG
jgi:hypothetical protein